MSSLGGLESTKGRFDALFIDQVGGFEVPAIASCQKIGVSEHRRNQIGVLGIGFKIPEGVKHLDITGGVPTEAERGNQSVGRLATVNGEVGRLEETSEAFRGGFAAPVGSQRLKFGSRQKFLSALESPWM